MPTVAHIGSIQAGIYDDDHGLPPIFPARAFERHPPSPMRTRSFGRAPARSALVPLDLRPRGLRVLRCHPWPRLHVRRIALRQPVPIDTPAGLIVQIDVCHSVSA
jgi:hypothetical protein